MSSSMPSQTSCTRRTTHISMSCSGEALHVHRQPKIYLPPTRTATQGFTSIPCERAFVISCLTHLRSHVVQVTALAKPDQHHRCGSMSAQMLRVWSGASSGAASSPRIPECTGRGYTPSQLRSRHVGLLVCTVHVNCFGLLLGTEAPVTTPFTAAVKACWIVGTHHNALSMSTVLGCL